MVPLFFAFAVQTMRMAVGDARQRCALFPGSKLFASVDRGLPGKWTDLSRCHRSAQTGGFPAATFAGTCKAMIAQRRGRVSFCCAGRTRSPGEDHCFTKFTSSAQDHSLFKSQFSSFQFQYFKSFAWHGAGGPGAWWGCSEHSASGQGGSGWPILPPPADREGGWPPAAAHIFRPSEASDAPVFDGRRTLGTAGMLAGGVGFHR